MPAVPAAEGPRRPETATENLAASEEERSGTGGAPGVDDGARPAAHARAGAGPGAEVGLEARGHGESESPADPGADRAPDGTPASHGYPTEGAWAVGAGRDGTADPEPAARGPRIEPGPESGPEHTRAADHLPGRPHAYPTEHAHPRPAPGDLHDERRPSGVPPRRAHQEGSPASPDSMWDDGFIARRAPGGTADDATTGGPAAGADATGVAGGTAATGDLPWPASPTRSPGTPPAGAPDWPRYVAGEGDPLRTRLDALRQLVVLSGSRLGGPVLAEANRVLEEAAARGRMSSAYTVVAVAGATGSGKSSLVNALAGAPLAEVGTRRPTTSAPLACVWPAEEDLTAQGPEGLLDRLGVAARHRLPAPRPDGALGGLVLLDLPDHDSLAVDHRERVDRLLQLVDAVVWVVDPEKYADALLHERYLRPLASYGEVTCVVLNQVDRLPAGAVDHVLHDLRRLLDEDGMPLGEHGEPGASVLPLSTLTGEGVEELRKGLAALVAERVAPIRRLAADLDMAVARLQPVFVAPGVPGAVGLTERSREEFEDLLALAVGARAAGQAAERRWLRAAERACGTPWLRGAAWCARRLRRGRAAFVGGAARAGAGAGAEAEEARAKETTVPRVTRPVLAHAVRALADEAACGLPPAWARTVREAAWRGAEGLPEALEDAVGAPADEAGASDVAARGGRVREVDGPRWWAVARLAQALLMLLPVLGLAWCGLVLIGRAQVGLVPPLLVVAAGLAGGPVLAGVCRAAARGRAQAYGQREEQRLRRRAAGCGGSRVLEPVAVELLRYQEVREQYVVAAGGPGLL